MHDTVKEDSVYHFIFHLAILIYCSEQLYTVFARSLDTCYEKPSIFYNTMSQVRPDFVSVLYPSLHKFCWYCLILMLI